MRAKAHFLSHLSSKGRDGQFSMLFAITAPIMVLYIAGGMDYAKILLNDEPRRVVGEAAAPAAMLDAIKNAAAWTDTPNLTIAAESFGPDAAPRPLPGQATFASAGVNDAFAANVAY